MNLLWQDLVTRLGGGGAWIRGKNVKIFVLKMKRILGEI